MENTTLINIFEEELYGGLVLYMKQLFKLVILDIISVKR